MSTDSTERRHTKTRRDYQRNSRVRKIRAYQDRRRKEKQESQSRWVITLRAECPRPLVDRRLMLAKGGVVRKQEPQSRLEFDLRHNPHLRSHLCCPFRLHLNHSFFRKQ